MARYRYHTHVEFDIEDEYKFEDEDDNELEAVYEHAYYEAEDIFREGGVVEIEVERLPDEEDEDESPAES